MYNLIILGAIGSLHIHPQTHSQTHAHTYTRKYTELAIYEKLFFMLYLVPIKRERIRTPDLLYVYIDYNDIIDLSVSALNDIKTKSYPFCSFQNKVSRHDFSDPPQ